MRMGMVVVGAALWRIARNFMVSIVMRLSMICRMRMVSNMLAMWGFPFQCITHSRSCCGRSIEGNGEDEKEDKQKPHGAEYNKVRTCEQITSHNRFCRLLTHSQSE